MPHQDSASFVSELYRNYIGVCEEVEGLQAALQQRRALQRRLIIEILNRAKNDNDLQKFLRPFHRGLHTTYLDIRLPMEENAFVLKGAKADTTEAEQIRRDYDITRGIYLTFLRINQHHRLVNPLDFFKHEGTAYYVSLRKAGKNLDEILQEGNAEKTKRCFKEAIETLAIFQTVMQKQIDEQGHIIDLKFIRPSLRICRYDPYDDFMTRAIVGRSSDAHPRLARPEEVREGGITRNLVPKSNPHLDKLVRAYKSFSETFTETPIHNLVLHGDSLPRNFLENGTMIDLERVCSGAPTLDAAALLWFTNDTELFREYITKLLTYGKLYNSTLDVQNNLETYKRELARVYVCSKVHFAFCYLGTLLRDDKLEEAGKTLHRIWWILLTRQDDKKTQRHFERIKEALYDYINDENTPRQIFKDAVYYGPKRDVFRFLIS